jgi:hypothetical protein
MPTPEDACCNAIQAKLLRKKFRNGNNIGIKIDSRLGLREARLGRLPSLLQGWPGLRQAAKDVAFSELIVDDGKKVMYSQRM